MCERVRLRGSTGSVAGTRAYASCRHVFRLANVVGWAGLLNGAQIVVWDFDKLQPNDRIGTHFLDFKVIEKMPGGMPPTWLNIYGAPEGVKVGKNKNAMNKYPDQATNYRYVCVSLVAAVGAVMV